MSQKEKKQEKLKEPPMMHRAQIQGRCNLQLAGSKDGNRDRTQWMTEWLQTGSSLALHYQYHYGEKGDRANASGR